MTDYRLIFDYHTHTVYSHGLIIPHGKGSVEDNVRAAILKGLKALAISDHGPGHLFYGIKRDRFSALRSDIEAAKKRHPGIEIYMSVEANIIDSENGLDLLPEDFKHFDFVNAGYHYGTGKGRMVQNFLSGKGEPRKNSGLLVKNTDMALRALYENDIKIMTHPGDKGPFDMRELARACAERGTLFEMNSRHMNLTKKDIEIALSEGVDFVISSDAHRPSEVGKYEEALKHLLEAGVPEEKIKNIAPSQQA